MKSQKVLSIVIARNRVSIVIASPPWVGEAISKYEIPRFARNDNICLSIAFWSKNILRK